VRPNVPQESNDAEKETTGKRPAEGWRGIIRYHPGQPAIGASSAWRRWSCRWRWWRRSDDMP